MTRNAPRRLALALAAAVAVLASAAPVRAQGLSARGLACLAAAIEPLSWRTAGTQTRVHPTEGAAARRLRHGRSSGAALSIACSRGTRTPPAREYTVHQIR